VLAWWIRPMLGQRQFVCCDQVATGKAKGGKKNDCLAILAESALRCASLLLGESACGLA